MTAALSVYIAGNAVPVAIEAAIDRKVTMVLYEQIGATDHNLTNALTAARPRNVRLALSTRGKAGLTYTNIKGGITDAYLVNLATLLGPQDRVDLSAEWDDAASLGGDAPNSEWFDMAGEPEDLAEATAYIRAVLRECGCRAQVGLCCSGWQQDPIYHLVSGTTYDYIFSDRYCTSAVDWKMPADLWTPWYERVTGGMFGPYGKWVSQGQGETGAISNPKRRDWIRAIPAAAAALPHLDFICYWSDKGDKDFTLSTGDYHALKAVGTELA